MLYIHTLQIASIHTSTYLHVLKKEDNGTLLKNREKKKRENKAKPKARGLSACETEKEKANVKAITCLIVTQGRHQESCTLGYRAPCAEALFVSS